MTVYVDDMYLYEMGRFGRMKMSHMQADTEEELHTMAQSVGVARKWYQRDHYDVAMSTRAKAIEKGAISVPIKTLGYMRLVKARTGRFPSPDSARAEYDKIRIKEREIDVAN